MVNGVEGNGVVWRGRKDVMRWRGNDGGKVVWYVKGGGEKGIVVRLKGK